MIAAAAVLATIGALGSTTAGAAADPLVASDLMRCDREHLGGRIDRCNAVGVSKEVRRPRARSAGKLKYVTRRTKGVERGLNFLPAGKIQSACQILRCSGSVVGGLVREQTLSVVLAHAGSIA